MITSLGAIQYYTGPWNFETAKHLLSRAMFAPSWHQIQWSVEQGMEDTISKLLASIPLPDPPVNAFYTEDPEVPVGSTWVNARYEEKSVNEGQNYRQRSLSGWMIKNILEEGISGREKLTLFFHNHFAINSILDERYLYRYIETIRKNCFGDYRNLTKSIAIDPSMLRYLNGRQNKSEAPNENFARELLELYTLGKGPQIGHGDYTYFTEHDIQQVAMAMTGWYDLGYTDRTHVGPVQSAFNPLDHSTEVKVLSDRFDHVQIPDLLDQEYAYVIDLIFTNRQSSIFLAQKLFRWYVHYDVSQTDVTAFIDSFASSIWDHAFDLRASLNDLWSSELFYEDRFRATMIKNPLDFVMSIVKVGKLNIPQSLDQQYDSYYRVSDNVGKLQMEYFQIPEAAGWKAYYRSPLFYRNWINATTIPIRMMMVDDLLINGLRPFMANGDPLRMDYLSLLEEMESSGNPDVVVDFLMTLMLPKTLQDEERSTMKTILLDGLPDFEWRIQFEAYRAQPEDALKETLNLRINRALQFLFRHPMFQLH